MGFAQSFGLKLILALPLLLFFGAAAKAKEVAIEDFYKTPTYDAFIQSISPYKATLPAPTRATIVAFSSLALERNPSFQGMIVKNFDTYSRDKKELLAEAMRILGKEDFARKNGFTKPVTILNREILKKLDPRDGGAEALDILWGSYFATGDTVFLERILKYAVNDKTVLDEAWELDSRKSLCKILKTSGVPTHVPSMAICDYAKELIQRLKKKYPETYEKEFFRITSVGSALWSLDVNAKSDPVIKEKIEYLVHNNPELSLPVRASLNAAL